MKIIFAGVVLADWFSNPAQNVLCNGAQVVDAVDIVGSANKRLYSRGNAVVTLTFSARQLFSGLKEAGVFLLNAWDTMPKTGTCECQCGTSGDYQSVYLYNAVLEAMPSATAIGKAVDVAYTIRAAYTTTSTPPQQILDASGYMILAGSSTVSSGASYLDITFSTPFSSQPVVTANLAVPSGGDNLWASVRDDLTTVSGTRVQFSGSIPASGTYKVYWQALLAP